jgi:predicted metalloprotease with PDZ domain
MSRLALCALSFVLMCCTLCAAQSCPALPRSGPFLAYAIDPDLTGETLKLRVDLSFRLIGVRGVDLQLPSEWEGIQNLYKAIRDIEVLSPQTSLRDARDPARRHLIFPSGQIVHMRYWVVPDWEGDVSSETYFHAILQKKYFQLAGRNFLVYPSLPEDEVLPLSFEWEKFPAGWIVASSLSSGQLCQSATTSLLKASNGLFVGGDFRVHEVSVRGKPVHVAVRGVWSFSDDAFVQLASKVLDEERSFWHDSGAPCYLISLLPSNDPPGSYAGAALEDSFTMFMGHGANLDFDMKFVLAHEMFHSWNPARLGGLPADAPPYWFVEGFTDYYARLLSLRAGLVTSDEYIRDLNASYYRYRTSPALHANERSVQERFFVDPDFQKLPYQQGSLLAQMWDLRIRQRSQGKQSLDDAMIDLRDRALTHEQILTESFLTEHFGRFVGIEARDNLQSYIDQGTTMPLPPPAALGSCVTMNDVIMYRYDLGLDLGSLVRSRIIVAVSSGSEADKAGLRNGQTVLEHGEIRSDDPNSTISLTVRDSAGERKVTYFPRGPAIHVDQYAMDALKIRGTTQCDLLPAHR